MPVDQNYIEQLQQRIRQLEFSKQELQVELTKYKEYSKALIDAAVDYEKAPRTNTELKNRKFIILKSCEKRLKELFYPKQKPRQATIEWLGQ